VRPRGALAAFLLLLVLSGCGVGGTAKIDAPVNVYISLPLTGPRAVGGRDAADAARLALEQAGGKAGSVQVRARYLDDAKGKAWDPVAVGANARTAVQDSSAAGYIGELDSEPTRASVPITNDAGLVQVSPGAGAVDLTAPAAGYADSPDRYRPSGSPNFARTVPSDAVVADAAAEWASELGLSSVLAFAYASPFQKLMTGEFSSAATEHGVQVQIARAANVGGGADAVYSAGDPNAAGGQLLQPTGSPPPPRLELSAELDPARLPGREFAGQFEQAFHRPPGPYAAYGYEAMNLVLQAIREAGTDASSFRDSVRNNVFGAHRDRTVLGSYSITDDGDTTECAIQRYRVERTTRTPLAAPCPETP
jgi:branched-chain amino acid transport system substrate-binding protein